MQHIEWKGHKVSCLTSGDKDAARLVLCIHGAGGNARHWAYQLVQGRTWNSRIMAVDLPGHGRSQGHPLTSIAAYSTFIEDLLKQFTFHDIILLGHSMGSAIALMVALRQMVMPSCLILFGAATNFMVPAWLLDGLRADCLPKQFIELAYHRDTAPQVLRAAYNDARRVPAFVFLADLLACKAFDASALKLNLLAPCHFITGEDDRLTPMAELKPLTGLVPVEHCHVVPQAGHMLMIEKPRQVNAIVQKILANNPWYRPCINEHAKQQ